MTKTVAKIQANQTTKCLKYYFFLFATIQKQYLLTACSTRNLEDRKLRASTAHLKHESSMNGLQPEGSRDWETGAIR